MLVPWPLGLPSSNIPTYFSPSARVLVPWPLGRPSLSEPTSFSPSANFKSAEWTTDFLSFLCAGNDVSLATWFAATMLASRVGSEPEPHLLKVITANAACKRHTSFWCSSKQASVICSEVRRSSVKIQSENKIK